MSFSPEVHALSPKTPPPLPNPIAAVSSQSPALPLQDSPLIPPLVPLPEYDYIDTFQVKTRSCSRKNFCANMTRKLFTKEEMISCNVRGVRGKKTYDKRRMNYIKALTFRHYPEQSQSSDKIKSEWQQCVEAIDAAARNIKRKNNSSS